MLDYFEQQHQVELSALKRQVGIQVCGNPSRPRDFELSRSDAPSPFGEHPGRKPIPRAQVQSNGSRTRRRGKVYSTTYSLTHRNPELCGTVPRTTSGAGSAASA